MGGRTSDYQMKVRGRSGVNRRKPFTLRTFLKWNEFSGRGGLIKVQFLVDGGCTGICFTITVNSHYLWNHHRPTSLLKFVCKSKINTPTTSAVVCKHAHAELQKISVTQYTIPSRGPRKRCSAFLFCGLFSATVFAFEYFYWCLRCLKWPRVVLMSRPLS